MKNKFFILTILAVFFVPLSSLFLYRIDPTLLQTNIRFIQFVALKYIFYLGVISYLWTFNKYISIFLGYCLFSMAFIAHQSPLSEAMLIMLSFGFLGVSLISRFSEKQRKVLLWCLVGLICFQGFWVFLQFNNLDPVFNHVADATKDDTVGTIGSHNTMGLFFAVTSPVILGLCPYLLPLVIFCLWCSTTTSAWAGFLASSLLWVTLVKRKLIIPAVIIGVLCTWFFFSKFEVFSPPEYKSRLALWKNSISQVVEGKAVMKYEKVIMGRVANITQIVTTNPWFGFGLANWIKISPYTQKEYLVTTADPNHSARHVYAHAHNDFVEGFW